MNEDMIKFLSGEITPVLKDLYVLCVRQVMITCYLEVFAGIVLVIISLVFLYRSYRKTVNGYYAVDDVDLRVMLRAIAFGLFLCGLIFLISFIQNYFNVDYQAKKLLIEMLRFIK